jgi:inosine-uridine nucleoside N-ribohydrolase
LKSIILDTDPGIDDALAIMLALNSQEITVEAVTTVSGNVPHEIAHLNALKILDFLGVKNVPVAKGATKPLFREARDSEGFHGLEGLGEAVLPPSKLQSSDKSAMTIIEEKVDELGKKLILVAVGPLTNIASSIITYPDIVNKVKELVIMGGAFNVTQYGHGNVTPVAEFNIWVDPEAAKIVFESGIPITAVGLDVSTNPKNGLSRALFNEIKKIDSRKARLVNDLVKKHVDNYGQFYLHDPLAVAATINDSLVKTKSYMVEVETVSELTRGQTVTDRRKPHHIKADIKPNVDVVIQVDSERFLNLFMDRVVYG